MPSSLTIAESIHSTWAARGRVPSVKEIQDVMAESYEAGRKSGAVEIVNRLRAVMKKNYSDDPRPVKYYEAVDLVLAVANQELVRAVGEAVVQVP